MRRSPIDVISVDDVRGIVNNAMLKCRFDIAAAVFLMYDLGLRISEVCSLVIADVNSRNMTLRVRPVKYCRARRLPLSVRSLSILRHWWMMSGRRVHDKNSQSLFGLDAALLRQWLYDLSPGHDVNPHLLRHSRATNLIDAGVNVLHVQQLLGHRDVTSTQVYVHNSVESLRKVVNNA